MDKKTTTKEETTIDLKKDLDPNISVEEPILKENPNRYMGDVQKARSQYMDC